MTLSAGMPISSLRAVELCATLILGLLTLALATEVQAGERAVECRIEQAGKMVLSGRCRFMAERGGSFALESMSRSAPLFGDIVLVSVAIVSPGVAEVRGLTRAGINSRWGEAHRSQNDPACWEGPDFRVCAH
jgi:hypothetical protein